MLANRIRPVQHLPEPVLDHGTQRGTGIQGVAPGAAEKFIVNIEGRLHMAHISHTFEYGTASQGIANSESPELSSTL